MKPVKLTDSVGFLQVNHFNRKMFDALIPLPEGTSYNAYLVKGSQKTALIDAADPEKYGTLLEFLGSEKPDYLIANHAEQDHSGAIQMLVEKFPAAKVVTNPKCREFLMTHLHIPAERFQDVKDGETLDLGGRTLKFVYTPWVHWPETMGTFLVEEKVYFGCDFFGSHLATGEVYSTVETVYEPMKRYFAEIMMPFRGTMKANLDKVKALAPEIIAPSHGPVHKGEMARLVQEYYAEWSLAEPRNKAVVAYVSMHGSTFVLVNRLVSRLQEAGVCVEKLNLEDVDTGRLAMSLVDAATIVIGTPTVLAGPHPKAVYAAYLANLLRPKTKFLSIVGSFGWGGKTVETLAGMIPNLKVEVIPPVMVKGLPTEADLKKVDELAAALAAKHAALSECVLAGK